MSNHAKPATKPHLGAMSVLAIILVLSLTSCLTPRVLYEPPALPAAEVAVVRNDSPIKFLRLDDAGVIHAYGERKVLPGTHTFTVQYWDYTYNRRSSFIDLHVKVDAGRIYDVRHVFTGQAGKFVVWLEDVTEKLNRLTAIANTEDQEVLSGYALDDKQFDVRMAAIEKLDDQTELKKVVGRGSTDAERISALEKIDDQEFLGSVAKNESSQMIVRAALPLIEKEEVLLDLALNGNWRFAGFRAFIRLKEQSSFEEVALRCPIEEARFLAVKKLESIEVLEEVAQSDESKNVRKAAAKRAKKLR